MTTSLDPCLTTAKPLNLHRSCLQASVKYFRLLETVSLFCISEMPSNCAVFGCFSNREKNKDLIFHKFPKDIDTRKKWSHLCKRKDSINEETAQIWIKHFEDDADERNLKYELLNKPVPRNQVRMKKGSVATLHMPQNEFANTKQGKKL